LISERLEMIASQIIKVKSIIASTDRIEPIEEIIFQQVKKSG
jgi:hypothetical protein